MSTLVLLPGLDGTGRLFADFVAALGPDIEVVVASYPAHQPRGYAELETVVRAMLPTDRDYVLLGESFSGPLAISIAASAPASLRGLILCCSFARNPLPVLAPLRFLVGMFPVGMAPVSLLSYFLLGRFASARLRSALAATIAAVAPSVLRQRVRAALTVDVSGALSCIRVPMLYLRASEDRVVPRSASLLLSSRVANARVIEFDAPHFLLQVLPADAAAAVTCFMSRTVLGQP
ncbi:MAG TPA: alpha/beta fold hydrolase [Gallionellaceae bacterium]